MRAYRVTVVVVCFGLLTLAGCSPGVAATGSPTTAVLPTAVASMSATASTAPAVTPAKTPATTPSVAPPLVTTEPTTAPTAAATQKSTGIAGDWSGTWQSGRAKSVKGTFHVTFNQTGEAFTGSIQVSGSECVSNGTVSGTLTGNAISFGAVQAEETIAFDGTVDGNSMSGTYTSGPACGNDHGTWTATRA